jgi:TRAP-type C4-dicarboxylate transport system permease small subunit
MKYFLTLFVMVLLSVCAIAPVYAADSGNVSQTGCNNSNGNLCNPLNYNSVTELIPKLLDIVAQIGLVVCTFFIIFAGFKYVTAAGNSSEIEKAHGILLWAVVGTAVLLGAKVLASILANTVNQIIK